MGHKAIRWEQWSTLSGTLLIASHGSHVIWFFCQTSPPQGFANHNCMLWSVFSLYLTLGKTMGVLYWECSNCLQTWGNHKAKGQSVTSVCNKFSVMIFSCGVFMCFQGLPLLWTLIYTPPAAMKVVTQWSWASLSPVFFFSSVCLFHYRVQNVNYMHFVN